ncbi:MAG: hypothetical protein K2G03_06460 [Bacilli bacterium]|nr:hypothetical protein [Bacilli bacterium]
MVVFGLEPGLGASYSGNRIENDEKVYGIGVIKVDEEKSFLIQQFCTNDGVDDAPALSYYVAVQTSSIHILSEEEVLEHQRFLDEGILSNDDDVKKLTKENESFGQRIISPFTRNQ